MLAVVEHYHGKFIESFQKLGLNFDLFTHTHTENHQRKHRPRLLPGSLAKEAHLQGYVQAALRPARPKRFLADRYIEGECPFCGSKEARGDQCDNCGKTYDAIELKHPVSKMTGSTDLEVRETEHFYVDLAQAQRTAARLDQPGQGALAQARA